MAELISAQINALTDISHLEGVQATASTEVSRFKRVLTVVSTLLTMGGCTLEQDKPDDALHTSPAAVALGQGLTSEAFRANLLESVPNTDAARTKVEGLAHGSSVIADAMTLAVDAAAARKLLDDRRGSSNKLDPANIISSISSPSIKTDTAMSVYVIEAGKLVKKACDSKDYSMATAREALSEGMPAGAKSVKAHAIKAMDVECADDIVNDYSISQDEEEKARARVAELNDPLVRSLATEAIDAFDASQLLEDVWLGSKTAQQAREDAANIADAKIKKKALAAISAAQRDPYAASEPSTDLYLHGSDLGYSIDSLDVAFDKEVDHADDFYYSLATTKFDALDAVEAAVGQRIAASHNLKPTVLETIKSLENPTEVIDLSKVEGLQKITNNCTELSSADKKEGCGPKTYQQFGEVFVKDGKLTTVFQDGGGLTDKIRSQMLEAIEYNRPFLEAAFASGELVSVHLIAADEYDPSYVGGTREIYMILPNDKSVSMDQFASGLSHETKHALTRNFIAEINVGETQLKKLNSACNNLRMTAYDDFELSLRYTNPEILTDIRTAAKSEHQPILDTLIRSIDNATFAKIVGLDKNELENTLTGTTLNQCFEVGSSASDIILNAVKESGVKASYDDLKYLFDTDAFKTLAVEWNKLINYSSVYDDVINESSYVQTRSPIRSYLGHSEDNTAEMYASLPDAAMDYGPLFKKGLSGLSVVERAAVLDFLDLCLDEYAKHPSLKDYVEKVRAEYAAMR